MAANPAEPRPCGCASWSLCPVCYAAQEKRNAERQLHDWLRTFGTSPDLRAPQR